MPKSQRLVPPQVRIRLLPQTRRPGDLIDTGYVPDAVGSVTFENVERRMRESNLQVLSLQESVDMLESIDYADLQEDLPNSSIRLPRGNGIWS